MVRDGCRLDERESEREMLGSVGKWREGRRSDGERSIKSKLDV